MPSLFVFMLLCASSPRISSSQFCLCDQLYVTSMSIFTLITGSELFKDYVGHVILGSEVFEDYIYHVLYEDDNNNEPTANYENLRGKLKPTRKETEEKLARYLKDFLDQYVCGDEEGFLQRAESEARRLTHEAEEIQTFGNKNSIGVDMLHAIGSVYSRQAAQELGMRVLYLGVPFPDRATALKILGEIFQGSRKYMVKTSATMPRMSTFYLLAYNSLQAIGWTISLATILWNLIYNASITATYASAGNLISFLQCTAFLEILHGFYTETFVELVPSGTLLPLLLQWGERTHFVLAVVGGIHEVQELPSVFITFLAWSISEVIRYSHSAFSCLGNCPSWITHLRYTVFIVLYPLGAGLGESCCCSISIRLARSLPALV